VQLISCLLFGYQVAGSVPERQAAAAAAMRVADCRVTRRSYPQSLILLLLLFFFTTSVINDNTSSECITRILKPRQRNYLHFIILYYVHTILYTIHYYSTSIGRGHDTQIRDRPA